MKKRLFGVLLAIYLVCSVAVFMGCNFSNNEADFVGTFRSVWREGLPTHPMHQYNTNILLTVNIDRTFTLQQIEFDYFDNESSFNRGGGTWMGSTSSDNFGIILFNRYFDGQRYIQSYFTLTLLDDGHLIASAGVQSVGWGSGGIVVFERV